MSSQLDSSLDCFRTIDRIGTYDVLEPVSMDSTGILFHAHEAKLNRPVAIKLLSPDLQEDEEARERFRKQAISAASINHENVVKIHYVGSHDETPFVVMEHLEGETLEDRLRNGPLESMETVRIGLAVANGLAAAHSAGVIHESICPSNIVLEDNRVVITGFGVEGASRDSQQETQWAPTCFHSPEQVAGATIDARSDLFSLGSLIYVMSTGRPPFASESTDETSDSIANQQLAPMHSSESAVPEFLSHVVSQLHAKDPDQRELTAADVAQAFRSYINIQTETATAVFSKPEKRSKPTNRKPLLVVLLGGLLLLFAIAIAFAPNIFSGESNEESDEKAQSQEKVSKIGSSAQAKHEDKKPAEQEVLTIEWNPTLERKVAKWVLRIGSSMSVQVDDEPPTKVQFDTDLPEDDFKIIHLYLGGSNYVDDFDIGRLKGLAGLKLIDLQRTICTGESLKHLAEIPGLFVVSLKDCECADAGLEHLAKMADLKKVSFAGTMVSDEGLSHLKNITELSGLYLNDTDTTDAAIAHFSRLKRLIAIELNRTQITDAGIQQLVAEHRRLQHLYVSGTKITGKSVPFLSKLKSLKILDVSNTQLSDTDVESLRKALPNCDVR